MRAVDAEGPEQRYPVEFTASAGEYFRIWIVNLVLTVLTLTLYSAWAKVRKRRYFHGHTRVDGEGFEYRGNPVAILKGRLIAIGVAAAFYATSHFAPTLVWVPAIAIAIAAPWLIVRSLAFNAYSTAYRNIRFRFRGTYPQCLGLLLKCGLILVLTVGLAYPYFKARLTEFMYRNHAYGTTAFEVPDLSFVRIYLKALGLALLGGAALVALGAGFAHFAGKGAEPTALARTVTVVVTLISYVGYLILFCYIRARVWNATWSVVRIGTIRFEPALRARELFWLYLGNILGVVLTLGLATPWAVVRAMRYRTQKMTVIAAGGLAGFVAAESAQVSAAGEEIGEVFDLDLSL